MSPSRLLQTVNKRLASVTPTAQRLAALLAGADSLPPTHEMRLASRLADMEAELRDLEAMTESLLAVQGTDPGDRRTP
jgi:hypothetical protein